MVKTHTVTEPAFALDLALDGRVRTVLWQEDPTGHAQDRVVTRDGLLVTASRSELNAVAASLGVSVEADGSDTVVDLDAVATFVSTATADLDPVVTLGAWNLIGDVARSVGVPFDDRSEALDALYDKVFAANSLPAVTPDGEHYEPEWSPAELELLRELLATGLVILRQAIGRA